LSSVLLYYVSGVLGTVEHLVETYL